MYECTVVQKDNVFAVHLCCDLDGDCLVRARISVDLWTGYDHALCEGIQIDDPENMNSEIVLPVKLFTDDTFMQLLGKCDNPTEVIMLLDKLRLI